MFCVWWGTPCSERYDVDIQECLLSTCMASLAEKFERHLGLITEAALSHDRMIVCDLCVRFLHALLMFDRASSVRNQAVCILPARSFWYCWELAFLCAVCVLRAPNTPVLLDLDSHIL